jgi:hypothetical protein
MSPFSPRNTAPIALLLALLPACDDGGPTGEPDADATADSGRTDVGGDADPDTAGDAGADADALPDPDAGADTASDAGTDTVGDGSGADAGGDDAADGADATAPDAADAVPDTLTCLTDEDGDRAVSMACGGDDCDDNDARRTPGGREFCDRVDNNCDGVLNDGIECTFLAHSADVLYRVDPFSGVVEEVGAAPGVLDIDTGPDGTLYAIGRDAFWYFDDARARWNEIGDPGVGDWNPNGLAVDSRGTTYVTSRDALYSINRDTGAATFIGLAGSSFEASGDCVVNKDDTLYMSSKHRDDTDVLVRLDGRTGEGEEIGPIGFRRVFGLTAAWGALFGLTRDGEIIEIDESTGIGILLHDTEFEFFGAASSPER